MKHTIFFFISLFFLLLAFFHQPLYATFPQIFEPINKFVVEVGPSILYVTGFLALIIAVFTWLPTWVSVIVFILFIMTSGFYLKDKEVLIKIDDDSTLHIDIMEKTESVLPSPPQ